MQKKYSEELYHLTGAVAAREEALSIIHDFQAAGGKVRLSIAVDHPEHMVKRTIEGVAASHFPADQIMTGLIKWAEADLHQAKQELLARVSIEHIEFAEVKA